MRTSSSLGFRMGRDWLLERKLQALEQTGASFSLQDWRGNAYSVGSRPEVQIRLLKPAALRHLFFPNLGRLGEAYVEGELDVEGSMGEVMRLAENLSSQADSRIAHLGLPQLHLHTKWSDSRAIRFHYDVSNEFYRLWLDKNMVYSCAYFKDPGENLDQAQGNKLDHICRKLQLEPGDRFLDVGCGWGGLILWAARHYNVKALGITLSQKQCEFARKRIEEEGLSDRCRVELMDYRELSGEGFFDKVASVGMFEHVGIKHLPTYFHYLQSSLKEGGRLLNHGITSRSTKGETQNYGGGRFIDRYVFPDGELGHIHLALEKMEEQKLEVTDVESLRPHYAKTLNLWYERFLHNKEKARELIGEKRFRIWNMYLPGCAYAFERSWVSIYQVTAVKNKSGYASIGPWTRDYIYGSNPK